MARVLAISSQVACGHVGLSAIVPALQALGHDVIAVPTVILSNHPGHPFVAGQSVPTETLSEMRDALERNGWLDGIEAVLTGYLPTPAHVAFAAESWARILGAQRSGRPQLLCDPILGDYPKGLYIPQAAAEALRERLVPHADVLTPNAFELGWLTGQAIDGRDAAVVAAGTLMARICVVTSVPGTAPDQLVNVETERGHISCFAETTRLDAVPNGTGDLFSAAYLNGLLSSRPRSVRLQGTSDAIQTVIDASLNAPNLNLVANLPAFVRALTEPDPA